MTPLVTLILGKVLDYLAENADEIIKAIKEQFNIAESDTEMRNALQELGYDPSHENLEKLTKVLKDRGEDTEKLASLLVTKTVCPETQTV